MKTVLEKNLRDRRDPVFVAPRIPIATYRLQFNAGFGFAEAKKVIPYLHALGITDLYASPYFKAKAGSLHGYDIVDHNRLNPEIGTEASYDEMISELKRYEMGQILDIVPNHMCVESGDNLWWMDVLENGPASVYAGYFDIDWDPVKRELKEKVLLPVLGEQYGSALENQELRLSFQEGGFFVHYYDHRFPVEPKSYPLILEHRIEELEIAVPPDGPPVSELRSILTAIRHLPPCTESDPEKVAERYREKEVIKRRLQDLCRESPDIRKFLDETIRQFNGTRGDPASFDRLDTLLRSQVYRLSHWRVAMEEINFRRFFDINSLAGVRMENPAVFSEAHRLILQWVREGKVTGLRVDHPDGLYFPSQYLHRLQIRCCMEGLAGLWERRGKDVPDPAVLAARCEDLLRTDCKPFYIIGEKILSKGERMPEEWPIFSTTGYVFLNSVNGIFIETGNGRVFDKIYGGFTRLKVNFPEVVYEKKKLVMQVALSSEINRLGHQLNRISERNRHTRDFTLNSLTNAVIEVIASFPVYRTYIHSYEVADRDRQYIDWTVSKAKRRNPAISGSIFDFLGEVLLLRFSRDLPESDRKEWLDFVMRFQQVTGPVTAKGVEDTAFYVYNRFVSLNEVGGMPERFGTPLETFHGQNIERRKFWPNALISTSTHDTKRSEDVRARLDVLSELPGPWRESLKKWNRFNRNKKAVIDGVRVPDRNEEYLLYQTLIGVWPPGFVDETEYGALRNRIREYMMKALREAKVNSSWIRPNTAYEEGVREFIDAVLDRSSGNRFLEDFKPFQERIARYGFYNSLSMTLLKIASPGVPDFYQGTELWQFSLVDPDNRRPVDFDLRGRLLEGLKKREREIGPSGLLKELTASPEDGRIKLFLTWKALVCRNRNGDLFQQGDYIPLALSGERADQICAFARRFDSRMVIVAVPIRVTRIVPPDPSSFGSDLWGDTVLEIPFAQRGDRYRSVLTGTLVTVRENKPFGISLADLFAEAPFALFEKV